MVLGDCLSYHKVWFTVIKLYIITVFDDFIFLDKIQYFWYEYAWNQDMNMV